MKHTVENVKVVPGLRRWRAGFGRAPVANGSTRPQRPLPFHLQCKGKHYDHFIGKCSLITLTEKNNEYLFIEKQL